MFGDEPQHLGGDHFRIEGRIGRSVGHPIKAQDAEPRDADGADASHECSWCHRVLLRVLVPVLVGRSGVVRERDDAAPGVRAQVDRRPVPVTNIALMRS